MSSALSFPSERPESQDKWVGGGGERKEREQRGGGGKPHLGLCPFLVLVNKGLELG